MSDIRITNIKDDNTGKTGLAIVYGWDYDNDLGQYKADLLILASMDAVLLIAKPKDKLHFNNGEIRDKGWMANWVRDSGGEVLVVHKQSCWVDGVYVEQHNTDEHTIIEHGEYVWINPSHKGADLTVEVCIHQKDGVYTVYQNVVSTGMILGSDRGFRSDGRSISEVEFSDAQALIDLLGVLSKEK